MAKRHKGMIDVKRLTSALCAAALAGPLLLSGAFLQSPGSAADAAVKPDASVWVIAKKSDGWCAGYRNYITEMRYVNFTTGKSGGDSGDDIVYVPVKKGTNNLINISVKCKWTTPQGMNFNIKPVRHQESWFVRIDGGATRK